MRNTTISKPTEVQIRKGKQALEKEQVIFCGMRLEENDKIENSMVQWVQCFGCSTWYHQTCVSFSGEEMFICKYCTSTCM